MPATPMGFMILFIIFPEIFFGGAFAERIEINIGGNKNACKDAQRDR
jgi:hypothetical protein